MNTMSPSSWLKPARNPPNRTHSSAAACAGFYSVKVQDDNPWCWLAFQPHYRAAVAGDDFRIGGAGFATNDAGERQSNIALVVDNQHKLPLLHYKIARKTQEL